MKASTYTYGPLELSDFRPACTHAVLVRWTDDGVPNRFLFDVYPSFEDAATACISLREAPLGESRRYGVVEVQS